VPANGRGPRPIADGNALEKIHVACKKNYAIPRLFRRCNRPLNEREKKKEREREREVDAREISRRHAVPFGLERRRRKRKKERKRERTRSLCNTPNRSAGLARAEVNLKF